jgi:hypothetical protein
VIQESTDVPSSGSRVRLHLSRIGRLPTVASAALALAWAGCGASGDRERERPVRATLDLETEPPGPADAGQAAGHGGGYQAAVNGPRLTFSGQAVPAAAKVTVSGARARVNLDDDGRFRVRVDGLRPGSTELRVRVVGADGSAWARDVQVHRSSP